LLEDLASPRYFCSTVRAFFTASVLIALLGAPLAALGCRKPCSVLSIKQAYAGASLVLWGEVMGREGAPTDSLARNFALKVRRMWKGEPAYWVDVAVSRSTCDTLGETMQPGKLYLIFASERNGKRVSGACAGSREVADATALAGLAPELDALAADPRRLTAPFDPPAGKDCEAYRKWAQTVFDRLAVCEKDADCISVGYGCPWGCKTPLNRRADGDLLARVVDHDAGCPACKYRCSGGAHASHCREGRCRSE
jgi:hypothetical protein